MALKALNLPSLRERVLALTEDQLVEFARARAMREADSSAFAGIPLDEESFYESFLALYRTWREEAPKALPKRLSE
jgi:hypothetical protein